MKRLTLALAAAMLSAAPALAFTASFGMPNLTWPTGPAPASQACFAPDLITPIACPVEK